MGALLGDGPAGGGGAAWGTARVTQRAAQGHSPHPPGVMGADHLDTLGDQWSGRHSRPPHS